MAIVKFPETNISLHTHGKLGRPWGLGIMQAGYNFVGDDFKYSGIYQRRPRIEGQIMVKMKHYVPVITRTEGQQDQRSYFADVKTVWDNLDSSEKLLWQTILAKNGMGYWNSFASDFMKRKASYSGVMRLGQNQIGYLTILG